MYKVEFEDLGTKVYNALKAMIVSGELKPGEKLVQEDLARRLGVSRTPLLSAFSKLTQENLVETVPRRGAYVKLFSEEELLDIYDIRIQLEPIGAYKAAMAMTPMDLRRVEELLHQFDGAVKTGDMNRLKRIDYDFHMEIMRYSGSKLLYDMLSTFNIIIIGNIKGLLKKPEQSSAEHWVLMKALAKGSAGEARRSMYDHINDSRSNLLHSLERFTA